MKHIAHRHARGLASWVVLLGVGAVAIAGALLATRAVHPDTCPHCIATEGPPAGTLPLDTFPGDAVPGDTAPARAVGAERPLAPPTAPNGPTTRAHPRGASRPLTTPLRVVVTIPPLRGLVEPLLEAWPGPRPRIDVLIPPGASEHGHELAPSAVAAVTRADLVVRVGLGLEPQVDRLLAHGSSTTRRVVTFAEAVGLAPAPAPDGAQATKDPPPGDHADHAHDEEGNCVHEHAADPHLWLDPIMAEKLVASVRDELARVLQERGAGPADLARLDSAAETVRARLREVHERYERALSSAPGRTIVVAHDAYGWLGKRYGLTSVAITGLAAGEPTPGSISAAVAALKSSGVRAVFVEPQLSPEAARRVAALANAKVLTLDPLGNGDWFALMDQNLRALREGLGVPGTPEMDIPPSPAPAPVTPAPSSPERR
ncbi:MAG TPA: metal ABC transporter substrate-binding protein [Phycisphaerales bacterium]|nr:metal ABC transporter substrate-binding protein [Phycisphaerales bacterium]